jgi:hypothetical protein
MNCLLFAVALVASSVADPALTEHLNSVEIMSLSEIFNALSVLLGKGFFFFSAETFFFSPFVGCQLAITRFA